MPVEAVRPRRLPGAAVRVIAGAGVALAAAGCLLAAAPAGASASRASAQAARIHHRAQPAAGVAAADCPGATLVPTPANLERIAAATLCLINQQRAAHGEVPLRADPALQRAAPGHSQDMVARHYFQHVSPSGGAPLDRLRKTGYVRPRSTYRYGENIAWGLGSADATPAAIVTGWMSSPEHRANILTAAYRDSGIGLAAGAPGGGGGPGATYTQDFGVIG